jgi:hypothetical protein
VLVGERDGAGHAAAAELGGERLGPVERNELGDPSQQAAELALTLVLRRDHDEREVGRADGEEVAKRGRPDRVRDGYAGDRASLEAVVPNLGER